MENAAAEIVALEPIVILPSGRASAAEKDVSPFFTSRLCVCLIVVAISKTLVILNHSLARTVTHCPPKVIVNIDIPSYVPA